MTLIFDFRFEWTITLQKKTTVDVEL